VHEPFEILSLCLRKEQRIQHKSRFPSSTAIYADAVILHRVVITIGYAYRLSGLAVPTRYGRSRPR
jgi:hypothetical protein